MIGVYWATLVVHLDFLVTDLAGFIAEIKRRSGSIDYACDD